MDGEIAVFEDCFRNTLDEEWTWIREGKDHWRFDVHGEGLIIDSLPGGIWTDSQMPVMNILVRPFRSSPMLKAQFHDPEKNSDQVSYAAEVLVQFKPECWGRRFVFYCRQV
jgi:hypothetical protein